MKYFRIDPASSSAVVVTTMTDTAGIVLYQIGSNDLNKKTANTTKKCMPSA